MILNSLDSSVERGKRYTRKLGLSTCKAITSGTLISGSLWQCAYEPHPHPSLMPPLVFSYSAVQSVLTYKVDMVEGSVFGAESLSRMGTRGLGVKNNVSEKDLVPPVSSKSLATIVLEPPRRKTFMSNLRSHYSCSHGGESSNIFFLLKIVVWKYYLRGVYYTRTTSRWPLPQPERLGQNFGMKPKLSLQPIITEMKTSELIQRPKILLALSILKPHVL